MGPGGMTVTDEKTCVVANARRLLGSVRYESCGKCVACREGLKRMHEIVVDIAEGRGKEEDLDLLQDLAETVIDFSLCEFGQMVPTPVLENLKNFRDEYEAHIKEGRCLHRKPRLTYSIVADKCVACGACARACPVQAVRLYAEISGTTQSYINGEICIGCGACKEVCRYNAVSVRLKRDDNL